MFQASPELTYSSQVMRDGSRWVMNKDKPAGTKEEPKQAQRSGRRLLQDVLSAAPDESLPVRLVSAIKVGAPCVCCYITGNPSQLLTSILQV